MNATHSLNAQARELAQRRSATDEIQLLWHADDGRIEIRVHDVTTGVDFRLEVAPAQALDAFTHPYAYRARRDVVEHVPEEVNAHVDG
jgi:hypothetical protein